MRVNFMSQLSIFNDKLEKNVKNSKSFPLLKKINASSRISSNKDCDFDSE